MKKEIYWERVVISDGDGRCTFTDTKNRRKELGEAEHVEGPITPVSGEEVRCHLEKM